MTGDAAVGDALRKAIATWLRGSGPRAQMSCGAGRDGAWRFDCGTVVGSSGLRARGIGYSMLGALENFLTVHAGMTVLPTAGERPIAADDLRAALDAASEREPAQ